MKKVKINIQEILEKVVTLEVDDDCSDAEILNTARDKYLAAEAEYVLTADNFVCSSFNLVGSEDDCGEA